MGIPGNYFSRRSRAVSSANAHSAESTLHRWIGCLQHYVAGSFKRPIPLFDIPQSVVLDGRVRETEIIRCAYGRGSFP